MNLSGCSREKDVVEMLACGHWPQACSEELRAHIGTCRSCSDLVLVTSTFQSTRAQSAARPNLPPPGAIWWRAQLRRRNAAVERVGRPILGAQIFALSVYLPLGLGLVVSQARHGLQWLSWFERLAQPQTASLHLETLWPSGLFDSGWSLMVLIPAIATLALLSGVVLFLVSEKQ
jgi:hypothetical protein